eukprot:Amastigsp_a182708_4.p2 type:complete len:118 gc:universal Amastigsp_a182708_4:524-171(-)
MTLNDSGCLELRFCTSTAALLAPMRLRECARVTRGPPRTGLGKRRTKARIAGACGYPASQSDEPDESVAEKTEAADDECAPDVEPATKVSLASRTKPGNSLTDGLRCIRSARLSLRW